jgi:hypothetical protein
LTKKAITLSKHTNIFSFQDRTAFGLRAHLPNRDTGGPTAAKIQIEEDVRQLRNTKTPRKRNRDSCVSIENMIILVVCNERCYILFVVL